MTSKNEKEMEIPKVVSLKEWETARQKLLVKEKDLTHARDALAAERRGMPWLAVEKKYEFDGPDGRASLLGWSAAVERGIQAGQGRRRRRS
jgi:predicted dithiol-disulfide oxidoreductase (DUF899 family)